jgi:hypothetical protein
MMRVDFSRTHCHVIHWGVVPGNERINGKPKGVAACEIRMHFGVPPVNMINDDFVFATIATKSPVVLNYTEHLGEVIYYACRYLNTRMEPGTWGARSYAVLSV